MSGGMIQEAIVVQRGEPAFLTGFVVLSNRESLTDPHFACQRLLAEFHVADYLKPAVLIPHDRFPRNANGKVDRVASN